MNIYIPTIDLPQHHKKSLFILTRPFLDTDGWGNFEASKKQFGVSNTFWYVNNIEKSDVYFIPKAINRYSKSELATIDLLCKKQKIKAYGYISGDFGADFGNFETITFFRMGGFKSKLSFNNKGFPVSLSDHFERIYKITEIETRAKQAVSTIGFCGHATLSPVKKLKEQVKFIKENLKRFYMYPFRNDYEPLFASAFERAKLLKRFEDSNRVITNFIYRKHYRAGAKSEQDRTTTTMEYYDNIKNSDYVLCVRGAGNFSVRLYETLMMGRIPVFVNTDCLLPFEETINWKSHVVWVEWNDRKNIAERVVDFHAKMTHEDFKEIQLRNRQLWKTQLSVAGILKLIENDIQLS